MIEGRDIRIPDSTYLPPAGVAYLPFQGEGAPAEEQGIHLGDFLAVLRKRWRIIACFTGAALVLAVVACLLTTPLYSASAVIHVRIQPQVTTKIQEIAPPSYLEGDAFMQDQVEILKSNSLAARIIRKLDLEKDPVLLEGIKPGFLKRVMGRMVGYYWQLQKLYSRLTGSDKIRSSVAEVKSGSNAKDGPAEGVDPSLVSRYGSWLEVLPITNTRMIKLTFTSPSPELSWRVANAHANGYIEQSLREKFQLTDEARGFLETEIARVEKELVVADDALNEFRRAHNVVSLDAREDAIVERLTDFGRRLTQAQEARITTEAEYQLVKSRDFNSLPAVIQSGLVSSLKSEVNRLELRQAELGEFFLSGSPQLQEINSQVRQGQSRIEREVARIVGGIESAYLSAKAKEDAIQAEFDQQQATVLDLKQISGQYIKLDQAVLANRNLYNILTTRLQETDVVKGVQLSNASILDRADLPGGPSHPNVLFALTFALVFGLGLGVAMAFVVDHLDDSLKTPEEVRRILHIPTLGVIPHFSYLPSAPRQARLAQVETQPSTGSVLPAPWKSNVIGLIHQRSLHAEAYRSLRTSLLFCNPANPPRSILVTSSQAGEGKTSTTVNLAISLSQLGNRVICVDADLRSPRCHRLLGIPSGTGLTEVLRGEATLDEVILDYQLGPGEARLAHGTNSDTPALHVLRSGGSSTDPAELLASPQMREVLRELGTRYDIVLIDSPPIFPITDASILAACVDGVVLVVRGARTDRQVARDALNRLHFMNATVVGVVLNGVDPTSGSYREYRHYFAS